MCIIILCKKHFSVVFIHFTASDDYSSTPIPSTLSLYVDNRRGCIGIRIINDTIVEGTEMFEVRFDETANNQILISGSNDIPVYIQDDESKL